MPGDILISSTELLRIECPQSHPILSEKAARWIKGLRNNPPQEQQHDPFHPRPFTCCADAAIAIADGGYLQAGSGIVDDEISNSKGILNVKGADYLLWDDIIYHSTLPSRLPDRHPL